MFWKSCPAQLEDANDGARKPSRERERASVRPRGLAKAANPLSAPLALLSVVFFLLRQLRASPSLNVFRKK